MLRSYGGDEFGRGAGVYDCEADTIFWYFDRDNWAATAARVQSARRQLYGTEYKCEPPRPDDVCLVHLKTPFPYDTLHELRTMQQEAPFSRWCEADPYECVSPQHDVSEWPGGSELIAALQASLPPGAPPPQPPVLGTLWQPADLAAARRRGVELQVGEDFLDALCGGKYAFGEAELRAFLNGATVAPTHYVVRESAEEAVCFMPFLHTTRVRHSVVVDEERWRPPCAEPHPRLTVRSFCVHATTDDDGVETRRYFRVYTERSWRDCVTPQIDTIFHCQKFETYDCFFIYALLGRLFFEVGQLDNHELTLFFEGIGGSGKSTVLKAMMLFWPPHLIGILSSNMQPQFGMSSVAHGAIAVCQEVSQVPRLHRSRTYHI